MLMKAMCSCKIRLLTCFVKKNGLLLLRNQFAKVSKMDIKKPSRKASVSSE